MPFINLSKDSSQMMLQSIYVVITIQMPFRFMWYRTDLRVKDTHVESALCTINISFKVTVLSMVI